MIIREKIFESPDIISLPELEYNEYGEDIDANDWSPEFGDPDSHPFWIQNGQLVLGRVVSGHPEWSRSKVDAYSGRLWKERKMISFWNYPDKKRFFDIIEGLSARLGREYNEEIDILGDPEWKVEVLPQDKEIWRPGMYVREENPKTFKSKLIPIKDYQGSAQRSKEDLGQKHVKSPMDKDKQENTGFGSKKYGIDKPLAWRQALVPESLDFERGQDPKKALDIGQKGYMCGNCGAPTTEIGENIGPDSEEYQRILDLEVKTPEKVEKNYCADCYYNDRAREEEFERQAEAQAEWEQAQHDSENY